MSLFWKIVLGIIALSFAASALSAIASLVAGVWPLALAVAVMLTLALVAIVVARSGLLRGRLAEAAAPVAAMGGAKPKLGRHAGVTSGPRSAPASVKGNDRVEVDWLRQKISDRIVAQGRAVAEVAQYLSAFLKIPKPVAPYSVLILGPRGSGRSTMAKAIGDTVYAAVGKSVTAIDIAADQRFAIEKFVSSIEDGGHMTLIFENLDQTGNTNPASSYWKDLALLLKDGSHGRMRQSVLIATATIDAEAILNDAGMLPDRRRDFLGKHCREIPQDVLWLFQRVVVLEDLSMEEKAFVVLQELRQSISKSLDVHVDIDKSNRDLLQNVVAIVADDYRDGPFDCVRKLTDEVAGDLAELAAGEARRVLVTHDGVRVTAKRG